jgi:hypothetical protein
MCTYEQTNHSCNHNVEALTEKCEFGKTYKPAGHDKLIMKVHSSEDICEECSRKKRLGLGGNGDLNGALNRD